MKKIKLTQGEFALVDDEDYSFLMQWKWRAQWNRDTKSFYAVRAEGTKAILIHRTIMKTPKGMVCDHINHDTLDNRRNNLRNVTPSQSIMNTKVRKDSRLGIKGVRKRGNSFQAQLFMDGKYVLCKMFPNLEDAIKAHADATKKYFGEFAHPNTRK